MKHFAYLLPVCCLLFAACRKDSPATEIIPAPRSVKAEQGTFDLGGGIRIAPADPLLRPAADYLAQLLREENVAAAQDAGNANLSLELDPRLPQQGYTLKITPARIELRGGSCEGVVSAAASLRQLLWAGKGSLPALEIDDAPRFAWRGFMLDVARHFFTKEEVMSLTDRLACYKFNRLHLHLTDDQGWRIEIKRYPLLTRRGAWRTPNKHDSVCLRRAADERDPKFLLPEKNIRREQGGIRYGGYYTQDDIREIVAYAAQRGIEVIPEIDLPGHSLAAIGCYPQLACDGRGGWGKHFSTPLCIGRDSTIAFCKNVLTELFDLFPSQYVHIGGDEVERTPWETCPDCQRRIRAEKLEGAGELQAWFTRETEQFLAAHGKTLLGWDEITEDGLTPQSAVMWWRSWMPSTLTAALQNGHRVIESPSEFLYLNGELDRSTLGKVYGWEPLPESLRAWEEGLLGIQANMWTEDVPTADAAGERLFPRLLAVAETAWSAPESGTSPISGAVSPCTCVSWNAQAGTTGSTTSRASATTTSSSAPLRCACCRPNRPNCTTRSTERFPTPRRNATPRRSASPTAARSRCAATTDAASRQRFAGPRSTPRATPNRAPMPGTCKTDCWCAGTITTATTARISTKRPCRRISSPTASLFPTA